MTSWFIYTALPDISSAAILDQFIRENMSNTSAVIICQEIIICILPYAIFFNYPILLRTKLFIQTETQTQTNDRLGFIVSHLRDRFSPSFESYIFKYLY